MIDIINTVICYNNPEECIHYAVSYFSLKGSSTAALVITVNKLDSYSIDRFRKELSSIHKNIFVYDPGDNIGYINGMVFGYSSFIRDHEKPKYTIMSNTDIEYPDKNILQSLRASEYNNDIWCIGPSVYVPSKRSYDNPVLLERTPVTKYKRMIKIFENPILGPMYVYGSSINERFVKSPEPDSAYVYMVHGCYFIITSALADVLMMRPFSGFLFSEETYISENVYHNGKKEYYDNKLKIYHNEHSVTSMLNSRKIAKYTTESMKAILQEYYE